jgi:hypothetical protein
MLTTVQNWIYAIVPVLVLAPSVAVSAAQDSQATDPAVQLCPPPVIKYTMAGPRACLIGSPPWITDRPRLYYLPTGAAENFPRKNGAIRVRAGTKVVFCLSRQIEGVWYPRSYGLLGTSLVLQWCRACKCVDSRCMEYDCLRCNNEECICADSAHISPWVTIGRDGAKDVRKGPSIGRAKVGIPILFKKPGIYYLRGIVRTTAQPYYPRPIEVWHDRLLDEVSAQQLSAVDIEAKPEILPHIPPAVDKDIIYVRVHVVDWPIAQIECEEAMSLDPDGLITPIPKEIDPDDPDQLSADLTGDELVNLSDFAVMAEQWGKELELPFGEDE